MPDLALVVATSEGKGYITASAGFGKTHLIAEAIRHTVDRQLVLTHTYAGVNALREKLRLLGVPGRRCRVTTIASWALQICLSYPKNADWCIAAPDGSEWRDLYGKCTALLSAPFVQDIIRASYAGIYVDEYQDCTASQHDLVLALANILPTRVLGDPLQAIFEFTNETIVDWDAQVTPAFEHLGALEKPWRWDNAGATELGTWLRNVRAKLDAGEPIDLTTGMPASATVHICNSDEELRNKQVSVCKYYALPDGDRVAALHRGDNQHKAKCHRLAKNTGGHFCSIEEIEGKRLLAFVRAYDAKDSAGYRLLCAIGFAKICLSKVDVALSSGTKRGDAVEIKGNTKNPAVVRAANAFLADPAPQNLKAFLLTLKDAPETCLCARDLFNRALRVLTNCAEGEDCTLSVAATRFLREFRHTGRPVRHPRILGTTLLLKGLEFEHAIVLNAASLSKKDLYVALTRGSKSLTILSRAPVLQPEG